MYLIRGATVSLGVFFLLYVVLSGIVACSWRAIRVRRGPVNAGALYGMRLLPLVVGCALVALFTIPSFLYLEPYVPDETIGFWGVASALGGVMVIIIGFVNALVAWLRASRFVASCVANSRPWDTNVGAPVFEAVGACPALLVAGVGRPTLLISSRAAGLLEAREMQAAIRHELAHVNRHDNLKKLVLRFCAFPFLAPLDREWVQAAEMAADDAAVSNEQAALDLASALIKIARASPQLPWMPELAMSLTPAGVSLSARVERLLSWQSREHTQRPLLRAVAIVAVLTLILVGLNYAWALAQMHELTELLIR